MKKKRALTLIEIMVVIMLITMITGTIAYNYGKSIDKGKEFKTKEIKARVKTIVELAIADGTLDPNDPDFTNKWKQSVRDSPLVQNGNQFLQDAWNKPLQVSVTPQDGVVVK
jgi:type II secretory pathway pseudopilin PulG